MRIFKIIRHGIRSVFSRPFEKLIYNMVGFVTRDKKLWVMGAQKKSFSCNPKYFFISSSLNKDLGVRCVWISRDNNVVSEVRKMGFEAENIRSIKGVYYCIRAGFYFVNSDTKDISFVLSNGASYVNLWHGVPLKKIQNDNDKNETNNLRVERRRRASVFDKIFNPRDLFIYDYILSPSEYVSEYSLSSAFDIPVERCLPAGYPRTDILFENKDEVRSHVVRYNQELLPVLSWIEGKEKVFLYAPTWRDTKEDFIEASGIDFVELNRWLGEKGFCFLLKMHPYTKIDFAEIEKLENIKVLDRKIDIYPLMVYVDVLITDYSSIYFDFLLADKPIVFFSFDINDYLKDCRSFYMDYDDVTPGFKVYSYSDLIGALSNPDNETWVAERKRVREKFWDNRSGNSSEILARELLKLSNEKC